MTVTPFRFPLRLTGVAVAVAVAGSLAGCSKTGDGVDLSTYATTIEPADVLYNQALANLQTGRLKEASRKFASVDRQHPYSEFARRSLVMGAFTDYRRAQYDDAIGQAKRYLTLYPASEDAAYAQYIIGLSHYRQIADVTRDQLAARETVRAMSAVMEQYPDSEYVQDAQIKMLAARDQMAGKEMQTGRYYQERREWTAAINRYRNVVDDYANTRHVEEALARLTESYYAMGLVAEAQDAAAVLGHNFPDSKWYRDSYRLLEQGGYGPQRGAGSTLGRLIGITRS